MSSARLPGSRTGQRAQDQAAEDRKQRRVGADAERERADDHERKAGALAQPTQSRTHVLPDAVDRANRPDVTRVVDGERNVAERAPARVRGLLWREAVALERVLPKRAVRLDLRAQIRVVARPTEEVQQSSEERLHGIKPLTSSPLVSPIIA